MGFRVVNIKSRCKLEIRLNYLVVRGETEKKILIDEISVLIIANTQISLTAAVVSRLIQNKVKIIFCDEKWNPESEVVGLHDNFQSPAKIALQKDWDKDMMDLLWQYIVAQKLKMQARVLETLGLSDAENLLLGYIKDIKPGDPLNREGLGAKVYFEAVFGLGFNRRDDSDIRNIFLNYGYSIILSTVNREICADGYNLALGIHHIGQRNFFNLGCDLVEPLRPLVDLMVINKKVDSDNFKTEFNNLLQTKVSFSGKTYFLDNAIRAYVLSFFAASEAQDPSLLKYVTFFDPEEGCDGQPL